MDSALHVARQQMSDLAMRPVSAEPQVSVAALYKQVAGREALSALVIEQMLGPAPPMFPHAGDGWLALRARVHGLQALVDQCPRLDQVVMAHLPNSPKGHKLRREGMAALCGEGVKRQWNK